MNKQELVTEALSTILLGEKIPFGIEIRTQTSPYFLDTKVVAEIPPNRKLTKTILRKLANESPHHWKFVHAGEPDDVRLELRIWRAITKALVDYKS